MTADKPPEEPVEEPVKVPADEPTSPPAAEPTTAPTEGATGAPATAGEPAPAEGDEGEDASGRHIYVPPHGEGFFGTLKSINHVLSQLGRKKVAAATLTIFGIGIGALLLVSGFSFWWTSQPSFCAKCHPMTKFVDAWEQSPHKDVSCEQCHLQPGLFGFLGGKIAGLQVVMNYVRGNYEDYSFNAAVSNASCLQCHESIMNQDIHSSGPTDVRVSHKDIIEAGAKCTSCHNTVAHGDAVPFGAQTHPTMATCLTCHNGQTAPLKCTLCHVGDLPSGGGPIGSPNAPTSVPPSMPSVVVPTNHPTVSTTSPLPQGGG